MTRDTLSFRRITLAVVTAALLVLALAVPGSAQHRARLSADLEAKLQGGADAELQVIATGGRAQIERLQARYGLKIKRLFRDGALLAGTPSAIDAAASSPDAVTTPTSLRILPPRRTARPGSRRTRGATT